MTVIPSPVFILGSAQSDFALKWDQAEEPFKAVLAASIDPALEDARLTPSDVEAIHIGNFAGELFHGQGLLPGIVASMHEGFAGSPSSRHEAACASGSIAVLAAVADLASGRYDTVMVSGVELMRHVGGAVAAEHLGAAAYVGREAVGAGVPWANLFNVIAERYDELWGLDRDALAAIARKNHDNARLNPLAQTRDWELPPGYFEPDDTDNPVMDGWIRKSDCGRITDGSATVILANAKGAAEWARSRGVDLANVPRISGGGHATGPILVADKLRDGDSSSVLLPYLQSTIQSAYDEAGISGPDALSLIETHDCFTVTELVAMEHFGITGPGDAHKALADGVTSLGGPLPVNPSGGLIGSGHPVGATGVRMLVDVHRQLSGRAGEAQVPGATTAATLNIGGSFTSVVSLVVTTDE